MSPDKTFDLLLVHRHEAQIARIRHEVVER